MTRALGIDYGRKRLGLALSDEDGILASPLPTLRRGHLEDDVQALAGLAARSGANRIVVGLPQNMDGSLGGMAREVLAFVGALRRASGLEVTTFDERLTSTEAERVLGEAGLGPRRKKILQDGLAAVLILQGDLDRHRSPPPSR